jgi:hypothetical protein
MRAFYLEIYRLILILHFRQKLYPHQADIVFGIIVLAE